MSELVIFQVINCHSQVCPGYDIKLDPAVLPLLTSFGGLVAERAFGRKKKNSFYKTEPAALPPRVPVVWFRPMCAVLLPIIGRCVERVL